MPALVPTPYMDSRCPRKIASASLASTHVVGRQRRRLARRLGEIGGDQDDQFGLRWTEVARAEQRAQDRDIAQARQLVDLLAHLVLDEPADGQGHAGLQFDRGLGAALLGAGNGDGADVEAALGLARKPRCRSCRPMMPLDLTVGVKLSFTPKSLKRIGALAIVDRRRGHGELAAGQEFGGLARNRRQRRLGQGAHGAAPSPAPAASALERRHCGMPAIARDRHWCMTV